VSFWSPALHQRRYYVIYLPPGYANAAAQGVRFPVLYLLHAPPGKPENYVLAGAMNVRYDLLLARKRIQPFLIALPNGRTHRFVSDTEWANARAGRYEDFVLDTVRAVDRRFSTVRSRSGRAIGGLSEGAYGATNIAVHHPDLFGAFESWSGYYSQTRTGVFGGASAAALSRNSPLSYVETHAATLQSHPLQGFLYQGVADDVPIAKMLRFAASLRATGSRVHVAVYGGGHNWRLWRRHFAAMLRFASRALGGPRGITGSVR
jgi:S-formylglutathione hydrolase FrmB